MLYSTIVDVYEKISSTSKRLEMTDYLVEMFRQTPPELVDKVVYLSQGKIYPDFMGLELGVGEKLALKAISFACGIDEGDVQKKWIELGDIGLVAEWAISSKKQSALFHTPLTVERVFENFDKVIKASGSKSIQLKIKLLAELLHDSTPLEAKYIIRTIIGKLRLGVADMTILDALALAYASKEEREKIEHAYNISSDLGRVARTLALSGIEGLKDVHVTLGIPLRAMLAERLSSIEEIFEKLNGKCAFEYKYDGLRIQAHIDGNGVTLFSRHLENISPQFPDVIAGIKDAFRGKEAVLEGECVPVDPSTGRMLPFQQVSHRRGRKYEISAAMNEVPVVLFLFDCMYADGEELVHKDFLTRRKKLQSLIEENEKVRFSTMLITSSLEEAENFFERAIADGCEGLMAKSISKDSTYRAGARGWQWIKYKMEYKTEMMDTVDLVVVGAFAGHGKRAGLYGALLMAAYNDEDDTFETVCKLGTGFDDALLAQLPDKFQQHLLEHVHPRVKSNIEADFWFNPVVVLEVIGAEISLSPVHTCGYGLKSKNAGFALRFPRFTGRWREDKGPEEATTTKEILRIYERQMKKLQ